MAEPFYLDLEGDEALRTALAEAAAGVRDPRPLLDAIGGVLEMRINARFDSKTDPSGQAWTPLAASTRATYDKADTRKSGPDAGTVARRGTLLERFGLMRASLTHQVTGDALEVLMSRRTDGGAWSIPMLHEFGTVRMPRRGIFTADPEAGELGAGDRDAVFAECTAWLEGLFD